MLSQPEKVRRVYRELRRVFGKDLPAVDLLKQAGKFVEFVEKVNDVEAEFLRSTDARSATPRLDVAFADGGWMVLNRERDWIRLCFDDCEFAPRSHRRRNYPELERSLYPGENGRIAIEWIVKNEE